MSALKLRRERCQPSEGKRVTGVRDLSHHDVPFSRVAFLCPVPVGVRVGGVQDRILQREHLHREVSSPHGHPVTEGTHTHVLKDKVPSPTSIQNLDPLDGASYGIHKRDARRLATGEKCIHADVVRTNPEGVHCGARIKLEGAVVLLREVERQLVLEHWGERAIREVVRTCRSRLGERIQRKVAVHGGVNGPCCTVITGGRLFNKEKSPFSIHG